MLTTKMNWCARTLLALISLGCAASVNAATITTFSTRTDFNAAVGASTYETFDSVVTDTPFHSTPFDAGAFTLSMTGSANHLNMIDVPPGVPQAFYIDGTPLANVYIRPGSSLLITFDSPITAFGADFRSISEYAVRTYFVVGPDAVAPPAAEFSTLQFFGFLSDTPFTVVELRAPNGVDSFGMDYVTHNSVATPVPEPATLVLLGTGLLGAITAHRARARK